MLKFKMWRGRKASQRQTEMKRAYDGYSQSFDEAIQNAPVRSEWLDEQTMLGLAWHWATTATHKDWLDAFIFVCLWIGLMFFVLSL